MSEARTVSDGVLYISVTTLLAAIACDIIVGCMMIKACQRCLQVELNKAWPGLLVCMGVVHQALRLSSWWWRGATLAKAGLVAIKPYD